MTSLENINFIMMLLDDTRAWSPNLNGENFNFLFDVIDQAQLKVIGKYYQRQDEKALRTLYVVSAGLTNDAQIDAVNPFLYPRTLIVNIVVSDVTVSSFSSSFINYDTYIDMVTILGWQGTGKFPKSSVYTVYQTDDAGNPPVKIHKLLYNDPLNTTADLYYIKKPASFWCSAINASLANANLELPAEYHPEVCVLAAEMMNDLNVEEHEISKGVENEERIQLKDLAGT